MYFFLYNYLNFIANKCIIKIHFTQNNRIIYLKKKKSVPLSKAFLIQTLLVRTMEVSTVYKNISFSFYLKKNIRYIGECT